MEKYTHLYMHTDTHMHSDFFQVVEMFWKQDFKVEIQSHNFPWISQGCAGASLHWLVGTKCLRLSATPHLMALHWQLENGYAESIYTMEMSEHCK